MVLGETLVRRSSLIMKSEEKSGETDPPPVSQSMTVDLRPTLVRGLVPPERRLEEGGETDRPGNTDELGNLLVKDPSARLAPGMRRVL